jgi:hypothetical protein
LQAVEAAGQKLKVAVQRVPVATADNFEAAFASMTRERVDGFVELGSPLFFNYRARLAELALKHRLPGAFDFRELVEAGGLMSYGADINDLHRRAALYIDKILKGAKPADLPVEQASKYRLVINLKTARALGLEIPPTLLARADEVIESKGRRGIGDNENAPQNFSASGRECCRAVGRIADREGSDVSDSAGAHRRRFYCRRLLRHIRPSNRPMAVAAFRSAIRH